MKIEKKIAIMGGGAAGFFAAITAKSINPNMDVTILEKTNQLLSKVRISGGGRCNVTHACFDPKELVKHYPRGSRELIGPFHRFQPRDIIDWFESRGVRLKTEEDGRIFPVSNASEEIVNALIEEARVLGVEIHLKSRVNTIASHENGFMIDDLFVDRLLLATGSGKRGYEWAIELGHTIQKPVPSLFTFDIPDFPLVDLAGVTVSDTTVSIKGGHYPQQGALLITHWGFSGPAALKLSAWEALDLHEKNYHVELQINWCGKKSFEEIRGAIRSMKKEQTIKNQSLFGLPKNLWRRLLERAEIDSDSRLSGIKEKVLNRFAQMLVRDCYQVEGKTTHKAEFVTCGGITLTEIDFKTMQSRICPGLFFAGEILNIDGVTGGFNFQNAWTTGYLSGNAIASFS